MDKCKNKRMKINCSLENKWKNENEVGFKKLMKVKKWMAGSHDEKWIKVKNEWLVLETICNIRVSVKWSLTKERMK